MYAHVSTYRLGTSAETYPEIDRAMESGKVISDQTARTIASWWHAPRGCPATTALSHGLPFDTEELTLELERDDFPPCAERDALLAWVADLEALLSE